MGLFKMSRKQICINIEEDIIEKSKIKAIKKKTTISDFVEEKLKEWVSGEEIELNERYHR